MKKLKFLYKFNESKMFDDVDMLIEHSNKFLEKLDIYTTTEWKKTFREIIDSNLSYNNIKLKISLLIDDIDKEVKIIDDFKSDILSHLRELDDVYNLTKNLSSSGEKLYDELNELNYKFTKIDNRIYKYSEQLYIMKKSFEKIDDNLSYTLNFKFD